MIKGQEKLCDKIDLYTMDTFPRTLLLLGEYGSGKHLLTSYIANKLSLEIEDISDSLTLETIDNITHSTFPKIYVIDSAKLTVKNENVILKFLEEPLKNAFIIVLCEHKSSIIPTVLNRCQVWELVSYEKPFLETFVTNEAVDKSILLKVATTPGKVMEYQLYPLSEMVELAHKIFKSIKNANFANVLTISRFIAFKNEKDKFDFNLFVDILHIVCKELYMENTIGFPIYLLTNKLSNNKHIFNIDRKSLFENYLMELKILSCGG